MGTIDLSLFEAGRAVHVEGTTGGIVNPSLGEGWERSKATFFGLLYGIVVSMAVVLPLGLLALAVWLVVRRVRARPATAAVPAGAPGRPDDTGGR